MAFTERNKKVPFGIAIAYRKFGNHARVFSQTLTNGNNKNEKDKQTKKARREP